MKQQRILAVILTLALIFVIGMTFVSLDNSPATAAATITEADLAELDFSVEADIPEGISTKTSITFDLAIKKQDGDENVKFSYYVSQTATIDVASIADDQWIGITKNGELSATQTIDYPESYHDYYFFKAERTVFYNLESTTYTYYYSTRGLDSCVVSIKSSNQDATNFFYFAKDADPQVSTYQADLDAHKGSVSAYEVDIVGNPASASEIISIVDAKYVSTNGDEEYNTTSTATAVNTSITFTINGGKAYRGRVYKFAFGQFDENGDFIPDEDGWRNINGSSLVIDKELMGEVEDLDANICFMAYKQTGEVVGDTLLGTDVYGDEDKVYDDDHEESIMYVRWSVASPIIGVTQFFTDKTTNQLQEYEIGKWASGSVTYVIELANPAFDQDVEFYWYDKSISLVGNNVEFGGAGDKIGSYSKATRTYSDASGAELESTSVSWTVSGTTENLRFSAKAGDVFYHYPVNCITYIDTVTPSLVVTARDYEGNEFVESDSGNIYAKDNLTFTLTNNETCVSAANAKYQYFDATGLDINASQIKEEDWQTINGETVGAGGSKRFTVTASASGPDQYLDGTYFFRIVSGAGVKSDVSKIDFSIDSSDYYFEMDENDFTFLTTDDGWAYEPGRPVSDGIKVFFTVKRNSGIRFFYNISSRVGTERELFPNPAVPEERVNTETGEKTYVYTCWINDEGIINGQFNFYAQNRAGHQTDSYSLSEDNLISIDSKPADVTIDGTIVGGSLIAEHTWVNGQVDIRIKSNKQSDTDSINVSGYEVYQVVGINEILLTPEVDGDYLLRNCSETNLYKFKFVTGAGVESTRTYQLNIESANIGFDLNSVKIYVKDENGDFGHRSYTIDEIQAEDKWFSTQLKFVFNVNTGHVAPFDIRVTNPNGTIVTVVKGSTDGVYIMDLAKLTDNGIPTTAQDGDEVYTGQKTFKFGFSLRSVAVDKLGESNACDPREIEIKVNRQIANIKIERTDTTLSTEWLRDQLVLLITNYNDIGNNEFSYQIGYGIDGELPAEWFDIDPDAMTFEFVNNQYIQYRYILRDHFNGRIYVRALNSAGFIGGTQHVGIDVSYDSTIPNVLRAIEMTDQYGNKKTAYDVYTSGDFTDGTVEVSSSGDISIYSSREVRLVSPVSNQYAPTLFFGVRQAELPTIPSVSMMGNSPTVSGNTGNWSNLAVNQISFETEDSLKGTVAYLYAHNGRNASDTKATKVTVYLDNRTPNFNVILQSNAGGQSMSANESGVWVFTWATFNEVGFSTSNIDSRIKVFYQVNIDGKWYDLNDERDVNGDLVGKDASLQYNYVFDNNSLYGLIGKKSIQSTVTFRVVTETGATYEHPTSVKLQVDTDVPNFNLEIISDGITYTPSEWNDNVDWVSNIVSFNIKPVDPDANPGGVIYSYTFGADTNIHTTLQHESFNSNNIVGLTYQDTAKGDIYCGEGQLTIYATARATNETSSVTIMLRIDALEPEFDIAASYIVDAVKYPVKSGDWVSVNTVNLELGNIGRKTVGSVTYENFSNVVVKYVLSTNETGEPETYANQSFPITEKTKITFTAESESGLTVVKTFEVNIDTQAPVVVSRIQEGEKYYVDERISWLHDDDTIKISTLNGVQFSRGEIVSVETINLKKWTEASPAHNGGYGEGYCELYLEDLAGNKVYFYFYMLPSELTVDNITLSKEDKARLDEYLASINAACQAYENGGSIIYQRALTEVRETFFRNHHSNLVKRLNVLESEVKDYQNYLESIAGRAVGNFTLQADYTIMKTRLDAYNGYAAWEQNKILEGETIVETEVRTYKAIYNTLVEAYNNLNVKMQQVETVRKAVQSLPARMVVEVSDYTDILKAYDAYMSLSADQKSVFNSPSSNADLLGKLVSVKARCEELMLTDDTTGVAISGDKLAEDKTIRLNVESVSKTTDDYINIQRKILSGVDSSNPRAVIAVYKLYLTGQSSANPTGTISIKLTIPEEKDATGTEYRSYTAFAVYKYLEDGTLITMPGVEIAPDGKSVSFEADSLGRYALAANSDIVEKSEEDTVYAKIGSITIDGTMIIYIAIGASVIFGVLIVILIITGIRRRRFLNRYDKRHRYGLAARGITAVPKGNPRRRRNPLNPNEYSRPKTSGTELPKDQKPAAPAAPAAQAAPTPKAPVKK